jgi:hypothetical protein
MSVATIEVPCGCVFEAGGEMKMVSYCPECEEAMSGIGEVFGCPYCGFSAGSEEEVDEHIVEAHLGIKRAPLKMVFANELLEGNEVGSRP